MAELGGMLAAAILKIGSAIGGQITLQVDFDKELKKMKMALESVNAVLEDAERRSITDKSTRLWLKRLKDFMYEISDLIDEFEADTQAITQPSARKSSFKKYLATMIPCLTIGPKITTANKMKEMRDDLKVITDQHKEFKLTGGTNANEPKVTDIRETSSTLETQIIGRADEREIILASLSKSMTNEITILPIYGIGGLGKTTLAKMVYNSSQFNGYSQVWVYVSQTFDLIKIGNSIISQLSEKENESGYTGKQMICNSLKKILANKKILIVLDDLWEDNISHLEELKGMLKVGDSSKVVVIATTRSEGIANEISTIQPYKLAPLTDDMCWSIIKQKSAFESRGNKEELEEIGKVIAMKCAGLALAAKSLGHMLKSMKKSGQWESVRDSNIWTASSLEDTSSTQVLASLKLSYSVMHPYLKLCFAYCSIFPKGHKILKDDLVRQWVSLVFSTWELGEKYISQLLGLSFLEHSKPSSTVQLYDKDITLLTMHDLVHDLARSVMDDEIIFVGKGNIVEGSCYRYALLDDHSNPLGSDLSKIRALRFVECVKMELHGAAISSAKSLRVLDLSDCSVHKLPGSIGELKQLRYLNAPSVQDAKIPDSITKLLKLIFLNLHGSPRIITLPESIGDVKGLAYLDLSGCLEISKLPESIGDIKGLLHLDLSGCSAIAKLPDSFGGLQELIHLDLSNCSCVGGISVLLESLTQLQYLNLSYCPNIGEMPEALGGLSKLQYLNLSFSSYLEHCQEAEFLGALNKLEYLNLSSKHCDLRKLPEALSRFIQLKYLNLSGCREIEELPGDFGRLKTLLHLDLSYCFMVDHLQEALVGLVNLQYLDLQGTCISMLPEDLTKLRYLNLSSLREDISYDNLFNHISINFPDLEHLNLSNNDRIESIPDTICSLRKLHTLDLSRCFRLQKIPESIHTVDSLKFLNLQGCFRLRRIPQVGSGALSLPGNTMLSVIGCKVPLHQWRLLQHFPRLPSLSIHNCGDLTGSPEITQHLSSLETLRLEDGLMEELPKWLGELTSLKNLVITRNHSVKELNENMRQLTNLESLSLQVCESISVPHWLGELSSLEILGIYGNKVLRSLPASIQQLNSLQEICLFDCDALGHVVAEPEEGEMKLTHNQERVCLLPTSLRRLEISNCDGIKSLPEGMQQLTNLQKLDIDMCPGLKQWCELEENKMKLAHIEKKGFYG